MFNKGPRPLSPGHVGMLFLIFGLIPGLVAWAFGDISGGMVGFCTFSIVFGLLMTFLPFAEKKR